MSGSNSARLHCELNLLHSDMHAQNAFALPLGLGYKYILATALCRGGAGQEGPVDAGRRCHRESSIPGNLASPSKIP